MRENSGVRLMIEYADISEIKAYGNNAKIHTAEQVEQIKESIKQFGFNDPIAVDETGTIIEGHGRLIAATELGMTRVPIIRLNLLSDEQKKAYMLVHNKLTMSTSFDYDLLMDELSRIDIDIRKYGFDLEDQENEYIIENKEYSPAEFDDEKFEYECQGCGFRFNA